MAGRYLWYGRGLKTPPNEVIDGTRRWISSMVIGLNLCPFAKRVFDAGTIRYEVTDVTSARALENALTEELKKLVEASEETTETTLLIHPHVLQDFLTYNDFLAVADRLLVDLGLSGIIQIASFHPQYQFASTKSDDAENYSNRSPYPMLHLLREQSISDLEESESELASIPIRNMATLTRLGSAKILERLRNEVEK